MKLFRYIGVFVFLSAIIFACDSIRIEKRRYMKGYHISTSWKEGSLRSKNEMVTSCSDDTAKGDPDDPALKVLQHKKAIVSGAGSVVAEKDPGKTSSGHVHSQVCTPAPPRSVENKVHRTQGSSQKKHSDGLLFGIFAFCGISVYGFLRWKRQLAMRLTRWANNNKWKARGMILVMQLGLGIGGHALGRTLGQNDVFFSGYAGMAVFAVFLGGMLFCPRKRRRGDYDVKVFMRRKVTELLVIVSGFLLPVFHGNDHVKPTQMETTCTSTHAGLLSAIPDVAFQTSMDEETVKVLKIVLMVLAIISIVVLQGLILLFSCSLMCQEQNGAAFALLVGGTALLALLAVFTFNSIADLKADTQPPSN